MNSRFDVPLFFVLACAITWFLDLPLALAFANHIEPPAYALPMVGLGALGPTLAALIVARKNAREVFGKWRSDPKWIVFALFAPMVLHLAANGLEVALGGHPARWFYPPVEPERIAALVMFSFGEEFGWRGFAYPRLADRIGPVVGSMIVGSVWGLWHLMMFFTPEHGAPDPTKLALAILELTLYSILVAWAFERSNRSMAVAIAFHMGGHLDNVTRAPDSEVRLRVLRFVVIAVAAFFAARSLAQRKVQSLSASAINRTSA